MTPKPTIWGISDLHLAHALPDRRDRFTDRRPDHADRIAAAWRATVGPDDLVLIPGDISMARNHRDVQPDLVWIDRLPGRKVLAPGNHDRWWNRVDRVRPILRRSTAAVDGDAIRIGDVVVCGDRGAAVAGDESTPDQRADERRALERLDRALHAAAQLAIVGSDSPLPIYVLWHYPPNDARGRPGPWVDRWEQAGVAHVVYGHLHTDRQWGNALQGTVRGVRYSCVAADAIGFRPLRLTQATPAQSEQRQPDSLDPT